VDWWNELASRFERGVMKVRVSTRQGTNVWIDLTDPKGDGMNDIVSNRTRNFWGMPSRHDESGWFFDYDDIEEVLVERMKEE
jgi:hypothetical protein